VVSGRVDRVPDDIISVGREQIAVRLTTAETGLASSDLRATLHTGDAEPMERFMRAAGTADDVMALAAEHGIDLV
jgi:hypothetical protein